MFIIEEHSLFEDEQAFNYKRNCRVRAGEKTIKAVFMKQAAEQEEMLCHYLPEISFHLNGQLRNKTLNYLTRFLGTTEAIT